jgi:hypothetical protein
VICRSIDAQGEVDGTPSAKRELTLMVKLTDSNEVAVSRNFKLTVK